MQHSGKHVTRGETFCKEIPPILAKGFVFLLSGLCVALNDLSTPAATGHHYSLKLLWSYLVHSSSSLSTFWTVVGFLVIRFHYFNVYVSTALSVWLCDRGQWKVVREGSDNLHSFCHKMACCRKHSPNDTSSSTFQWLLSTLWVQSSVFT